ncbi:MAG: PDZ domain-containing protein, partial [Pirellulales bacterium]
MLWNRCKNTMTWLAIVAGILGSGAWAQAQSDTPAHRRVVRLLRLPFNAGVLKVVLAADEEGADTAAVPRQVIVDDVLIDDTERPAAGRHWIGLSCYPADETLRNQLKLGENEGLVVEAVVPEGPAAQAGIEAGDVLLKAGDKPLGDVPDLVKAIVDAGDKPLSLSVLQAGESKTIEVTPALRDVEVGLPALPLEPGEVRHWLERMGAAAPQLA